MNTLKRFLATVPLLALAFFATAGVASAHECDYDGEERDTGNQSNCEETHVVPNWRDGNYIPLFDIADRDDPEQRRDAQRWRDCSYYDEDGYYQNNQFCIWLNFGNSFEDSPNEVHAGSGGQHCFLGEFAHDCSDHDRRHGEGVHDAHGGANYVDVCLADSEENRYCDDGLQDTQAGVTIMDHNPCGTIVPIVACTDEYHVIRPFDQAYTTEQMEDSAEYIPRILADPILYLCGYEQYRGGPPPCGGDDGGGGGVIGPVTPLAEVAVPPGTGIARAALDARPPAVAPATGALGSRTLARRTAGATDAASSWGGLALALAAITVRARRFLARVT